VNNRNYELNLQPNWIVWAYRSRNRENFQGVSCAEASLGDGAGEREW